MREPSDRPAKDVPGRTDPATQIHCVFGRDGSLRESARFRAADADPEDGSVRPFLALMDPADRRRLRDAVQATDPGATTGPIETRVPVPDGEEETVVWSLRGEDDHVLATAEVHDRSEPLRPDEAGRFFDRIATPAFVIDAERRVLAANRAARALMTASPVGDEWTALVAAPEEASRHRDALAETVSRGRRAYAFHAGLPGTDGHWSWHLTALGTGAPLGRPHGYYVVGFDETDQEDLRVAERTAFEERVHAESAERLAAFARHVLNNAAHGLRTPLTPIQASIHILRDRLDTRFDETSEVALETLEIQVRRLADLVDDVLDVSALENETLQLWSDRLELGRIVRGEVERFRERARRTGIDLRLRVQDGLVVEVDKARMARVVRHLLSNAFEHVQKGGSVQVVAAHEDGHAIVRIHNTGPALRPGGDTDLFQAFTTQPGVHGRGSRGAGLGLVFCKGVVESFGGEIWHDLGLRGEGTEIAFSLPVVVAGTDGEGLEGGTPEATKVHETLIGKARPSADLAEDAIDTGVSPYTPT